MTDKQIIVDGVDVSGCECYSEHREGYCGWHIPCEGDICPYKLKWALQQLKRKEQECEFSNLRIIQLQETLSQYETDLSTKDCIVETCKAQYKELKAELEQEKNWHKTADEISKANSEYTSKLKAENEELKKEIDNKFSVSGFNVVFMREHIHNLKQTLKEIKEIIEFNKTNRLSGGACISIEQILQKISEVVDDKAD